MRRSRDLPRNRLVWRLTAALILVCLGLSLAACKPRNQPTTASSNVPVETGTVQAALPGDTTTAPALPTTSTTPIPQGTQPPTTNNAPPVGTTPQAAGVPSNSSNPIPGPWPARVGVFAKAFKVASWYPQYIPAGYKVDSLDIVELDKGSGLVLDIAYLNGEKVVQFTQGSPNTRDYEIPAGAVKVPWGTQTASITHQDPTDASTPIIIVYSKGGNFAELTGDVSEAELKAIAKSMKEVK